MMARLDGHVSVVTGGNGGIGLGLARGLVAAGAAVALWGRDVVKTDAAVTALRADGADAFGVRCDVSEEDEVEAAMAATVERFGQVDSVFANAGMPGSASPLAELSLAEWRNVVSVNLDGAFLTLREGARHMTARGGGGAMVVVSSTASIHGAARKAHYGASKTALLGLMRAVAVELAPHGIRCNALLPGWAETDMTSPGGGFSATSHQKFVDATIRRTPVRRWAAPEEFGAAAVFLADPSLTFHTGDAMVFDGGYTVF